MDSNTVKISLVTYSIQYWLVKQKINVKYIKKLLFLTFFFFMLFFTGASERILNLRQQMRTVELDVSLSRKQSAEVILEMKDELRRALTKANRSVLDQLGITP